MRRLIFALTTSWLALSCTQKASDEEAGSGAQGGTSTGGSQSGGTGGSAAGTTGGTGGSAGAAGAATGGSGGTTGGSGGVAGSAGAGGAPPVDCDWPGSVNVLDVSSGSGTLAVNFADGADFTDMDWTAPAACFGNPLENELYNFNHLPFGLSEEVPPWSRVTITATPSSTRAESNLYVVAQKLGTCTVPPNLDNANTYCDATGSAQGSAGDTTSITYTTYQEGVELFFGVGNRDRWADDDTSDLTVNVTVEALTGTDRCYGDFGRPEEWPWHANVVDVDTAGGKQLLRGDLQSGAPLCELDFLESNFCTPSTDFDYFRGNAVFYALDEAIPDASILTVRVVPDPGVEVSLVGYEQGVTGFDVPTLVNVSRCEVGHNQVVGTAPNPGVEETITFPTPNNNNPSNLFFAVVGDGLTGMSGGYSVEVDLLVADIAECSIDDYQSYSAWPTSRVEVVTLDSQGEATLFGSTASGSAANCLDWAQDNFCWPGTVDDYFDGKHVYYALEDPIEAGSILEVTVTPEAGGEVSIFGYSMGSTSYYVPPLMHPISCDASHHWTLDHASNYGMPEYLEFQNPPGNHPYNYAFAVAGRASEPDANYTVRVRKLVAPPPHCPESLPGATYPIWPGNVTQLSLDSSNHASGSGNLSSGGCMNLNFADDSSIACFPSTQFQHFKGNQVMFALDQPMPPHSELRINVTPDPTVEANVYAFQAGATSYPMPPAPSGVISCEASFNQSLSHTPNPGETESIYFSNPTDNNSYNVMFVVSGDDQTGTSGGFTYDVQLTESVEHCPQSLPGQDYSSWPSQVTTIALDASGEGEAVGDLADGSCMNLDWAEDNFCFPGTRFDHFQGNHVFFALESPMPINAYTTISLIPDPGVDANLYVLQTGTTSFPVPPKVNSSVTCEASYPFNVGHDPNPGEPEYAYVNSTTNSYNVFIGVAGNGTDGIAGRFKLEINQQQAVTHCPSSLPGESYISDWPGSVSQVEVDSNGDATVAGSLSGSCTNLDWAQNSSTACFTGLSFSSFEGDHEYFALAETLPPRSIATITLTPKNGADLNLYGYMIGANNFPIPPAVPSVVTCEASFGAGADGAEQISFQNPTDNDYNLFWAVAGATGVTTGDFDINVDIQTSTPHCPGSLPGQSFAAYPSSVETITLSGSSGSANGDLSSGACTNLEWAANSTVACFPGIQDTNFQGSHRYYTLDSPLPAGKKLVLTLTPNAGVDVSLYSYLTSTSSFLIPPWVPGVPTCEATHAQGPGGVETLELWNMAGAHNVLIGVAGIDAQTSGAYTLDVEVQDI